MFQLSSIEASFARTGSSFRRGSAAPAEAQVNQYTPLLYNIAHAFGFTESEARDLVAQVCAYALSRPAADCYPLRLWVSKIMVHLCTFHIGRELFSQSGVVAERQKISDALGDFSRSGNAREQCVKGMPLSYRAVYLLRDHLGFTTSEIALLLNTTPPKVLERYAHALALLKG